MSGADASAARKVHVTDGYSVRTDTGKPPVGHSVTVVRLVGSKPSQGAVAWVDSGKPSEGGLSSCQCAATEEREAMRQTAVVWAAPDAFIVRQMDRTREYILAKGAGLFQRADDVTSLPLKTESGNKMQGL